MPESANRMNDLLLSPRRKKVNNKLYRTPPTPEPEEFHRREKMFVLDNNATSSISQDYSKTNPKLGPVIPPYNAQNDKLVVNYFQFQGVDKTLEKTQQLEGGTSIEGKVADTFALKGAGTQYVALRNMAGAGHSRDLIDGHGQFMQGIRPVRGYNGDYGFRRNTPWLRTVPSPFGTASKSPTH
ncbi:hypothetical protein ScPMuIL_012135 [Solemya velum]